MNVHHSRSRYRDVSCHQRTRRKHHHHRRLQTPSPKATHSGPRHDSNAESGMSGRPASSLRMFYDASGGRGAKEGHKGVSLRPATTRLERSSEAHNFDVGFGPR